MVLTTSLCMAAAAAAERSSAETPAEQGPAWDLGDLYRRRPTTRRSRTDLAAAAPSAGGTRDRPTRAGWPSSTATSWRDARALRGAGRPARPGLLLRPAALCRRTATTPRSAASSRRAGAGQRHLDPAPVRHPRAEQARGRAARRAGREPRPRLRPLPALARRGAAATARTSSTTRSSGRCTRSTSPAAAPGCGCSTRRWLPCASRSTARI